MDAKLSSLLKGLIGVIFGGLALVVPGPVPLLLRGYILGASGDGNCPLRTDRNYFTGG